MNDQVIPILAQWIDADRQLLHDTRRLRALLNDLVPEQRTARHLLVQAAEIGVATTLAELEGACDALLVGRLVALMIDEYSVTEQAARWAVGAWAQALGKSLPAPQSQSLATDPQPSAAMSLVQSVKDQPGFSFSLAWNSAGDTLASGGADGLVRLWRLGPRSQLTAGFRLNTHRSWVLRVGWRKNGTSLISASAEQICLWQPGQSTPQLALRGAFELVAWNPGVSLLASHPEGSRQRELAIWDLAQRQVIQRFTAGEALDALAWSYDGRWLIGTGASGLIEWWQIGGIAQDQLQDQPGRWCLAAHPQHAIVACAGEYGAIRIWHASRDQPLAELAGQLGMVRCLAWHPAGELLAAGAGNGVIEIWQTDEERLVARFQAHPRAIYSLAWHPAGRLLASAGADGMIKLWRGAVL